MVTVWCRTYNHEKFIEKALQGFVMQKTNFRFEVIVCDDCSTDSNAQIIKSYAEKYPDIIKPILLETNHYSKKIKIMPLYLPTFKGKYIAFCEGDDFWQDENKLQTQFDALESNPGCVASFNRVEKVFMNNESTGQFLPYFKIQPGVIESKKFLSTVVYPAPVTNLAFQLSGCMMRTDVYREYWDNKPQYAGLFMCGDIPIFLHLGMKGDVYYIDKPMSCYRVGNPNSYVGNILRIREKAIKNFECEKNAFLAFDEYSDYIVHEHVLKAIRGRKFSILRANHDIKGMKTEEMADLFSLLSKKQKFKEYLLHYFPFMEKFVNYVKFNRKKQKKKK